MDPLNSVATLDNLSALLARATRAGRQTSEFMLAIVYVLAVPVLDAIVSAIRDDLSVRQAEVLGGSPWLPIALAASSAVVVGSYAISRGMVKAKTAEAAARALGDAHIGAAAAAGGGWPFGTVDPDAPAQALAAGAAGSAAGAAGNPGGA
jgi:hypothetical protein